MILPSNFESYFRERWRGEDVAALLAGLAGEPQVSIRLNLARLPADAEPEGADGRVPWCPEGVYLRQRPTFTADPLLHAGVYYVQEASSMFLAHVLRTILRPSPFDGEASPGDEPFTFQSHLALDLCAAPGGKSTLLRSLLPDDCLLVSNEPHRARCQVLAENLSKWGHPGVVVTQAGAADFARLRKGAPRGAKGRPKGSGRKGGGGIPAFDLILADVPCSGEGMMRKEDEAVRQWSPSFVAECAALQRTILADVWPALRPGGILIYSTCTFNPEEDEENVAWAARELGAEVIAVPVECAWGIRGDLRLRAACPLPCCHFLPGQVRGEGFFLAVLRKHGESGGRDSASDGIREVFSSQLTVLPVTPLDVPVGESPATWPRVELTLSDAMRYLQREALVLPEETPRGIVQVCYRGQRLGLMKNLGTRANNLYPREWRIRNASLTPHTLFP